MIRVKLELNKNRWAFAYVLNEQSEVTLELSFLTDALKDFLAAAMLIAEGVSETKCCWQDEPGEFRWLIACKGNALSAKILAFNETCSGLSDDKGEIIFAGNEDRKRFCSMVKQQYDRLMFHHGLSQYKELWGHDFPQNELDRLDVAIKSFSTSF